MSNFAGMPAQTATFGEIPGKYLSSLSNVSGSVPQPLVRQAEQFLSQHRPSAVSHISARGAVKQSPMAPSVVDHLKTPSAPMAAAFAQLASTNPHVTSSAYPHVQHFISTPTPIESVANHTPTTNYMPLEQNVQPQTFTSHPTTQTHYKPPPTGQSPLANLAQQQQHPSVYHPQTRSGSAPQTHSVDSSAGSSYPSNPTNIKYTSPPANINHANPSTNTNNYVKNPSSTFHQPSVNATPAILSQFGVDPHSYPSQPPHHKDLHGAHPATGIYGNNIYGNDMNGNIYDDAVKLCGTLAAAARAPASHPWLANPIHATGLAPARFPVQQKKRRAAKRNPNRVGCFE